MSQDFAPLVAHLSTSPTVTVITARADGREIAVPIWSVVVDGVPYVRAAFGESTAWFRRAVTRGPVSFTLAPGTNAEVDPIAALDDPRVTVDIERLSEDDTRQDAISAAFEAKYLPLSPEHVGSVVSADARLRTLAVRPAN